MKPLLWVEWIWRFAPAPDELADELAVIDHGRVIATGTPEELKANTGARFLAVRTADPVDVPVVISVVGQLAGVAPEDDDPRVAHAGANQAQPVGTGGLQHPTNHFHASLPTSG